MTKTVFITTTGAGTYQVPADYSSLVSIECVGGDGIGWIQTSDSAVAGPGGGGGGGGGSTTGTGTGGGGGTGGLYGGGGGAAGDSSAATNPNGGNGAQGIIIFKYIPTGTFYMGYGIV